MLALRSTLKIWKNRILNKNKVYLEMRRKLGKEVKGTMINDSSIIVICHCPVAK